MLDHFAYHLYPMLYTLDDQDVQEVCVGWMSGQDIISQNLFRTARCNRKKEKNKIKTIKIRRSATKGLTSTKHANFTMKKKYYKRRSHPQPSYIQFLPHKKFFLTKALSFGRPPEPLKRLLSKNPAPSLPTYGSLSSLFTRF